MNIAAIIPARYASKRFPGKLLAKETGKYLIQHVYEQVKQADLLDEILVATDDKRICQACDEFGATWCMTRADHPSGTDRIAEAAAKLTADIIINIQGDEPEIEPKHIDYLVKLLQDNEGADMATLAATFLAGEDITSPNIVKVVTDLRGYALYFSRSVIPFQRDKDNAPPDYYKHLGIYAYRRDILLKLSRLSPTPLEQTEKLEQLRALENGFSLMVGIVEQSAAGIDTPTEYAEFVKRYNKE